MKHITHILYLFAFLPLLVACDHIADNDRLIEVKVAELPDNEPEETPTSVVRNVLLEDFTGQRCVNCPLGTAVIEQMQEAYGDRLIAVGIHSGPLGFKGNATNLGLATAIGDEYYNYWQLQYQPVGLIDRHGAINYDQWITAVRDELSKPSATKMTLEAAVNGDQIAVTIQEDQLAGNYSGKLQVWVLEDGITALQVMPEQMGGGTNRNYVHNHVLRTAVNGTWGEDLTLAQGEEKQQTMTQPIDASWNKANLSVVAFIYNSDGVEQAVKAEVKQ